jgi:hypothetical protein
MDFDSLWLPPLEIDNKAKVVIKYLKNFREAFWLGLLLLVSPYCVQVDEDNSGSIDFDEFLTMMKKKMMENDRRSEDVRAAFQVFDQVQLTINLDGIFSLSKRGNFNLIGRKFFLVYVFLLNH